MAQALKNTGISIGTDTDAASGAPSAPSELVCILGLNVLENTDLTLHVANELKEITTELNLPFIFKASFDKANRSSADNYRGPGLTEGLDMLAAVKKAHNIPIATDIHEAAQAEIVAEVADVLQVPAFLCRQTDLITAAAQAIAQTGGWLHIKKAQFLAPWDVKNIIHKAQKAAPKVKLVLCERGTSFGYNNLVVDMAGIAEMQKLGVPVTIDATHAAQLPGADPRTDGASTGGRRDAVPLLAKAAVAAGADGVFLEFHPEPDKALCDAPSCLPLAAAKDLLASLKSVYKAVR